MSTFISAKMDDPGFCNFEVEL